MTIFSQINCLLKTRGDSLRNFGYVPPRGASKAGKYLAYNRKMNEFKKVAKLRDAYALDVFFYHHAQEL